MKKRITLALPLSFLCFATQVQAGFVDYFKEEDGSTNWQYIANFSSSVLILALLITSIFLFFNMRRAYKANKELNLIRNSLEKRVAERTETLNESNRLLQQANEMLEGEVNEHKETTSLLQSSEAYIKSILDSMPLMLIGLNKDLAITQWNNSVEETTGMTLDQVQGKYLWDAYPTITLSPKQVKHVLDKGESSTIKLSQRGQYYFDITLYPVVGPQETGIVIMIDDVTQQSKAANLLIQKDKFSALGELAAAMAHDINIPLGAIERNIDHLKDKIEKDETEASELIHKLRDSRESSRQASAIISHLIEFSNSESQKKQSCSIPDIIDHALIIAASMFSDTNGLKFSDIKINRSYADDLPLVPCHMSEIQQVCISIFRHACYSLGKISDASRARLIEIDVSEFYDSLWIKIQHNGPGLNGNEQMTIFEPFYQNDDITEGCEMENRLSFPYFIVTEHHGGQMAVTSDIDIGTTFHIQLQLK